MAAKTTKEEALVTIKALVERFDEQKEFYKKKDFNEAQTRSDFINPFWQALGWDVVNKSGAIESYREVIHEDKVKVGGSTKAPDYSFRLPGGKRLFFLEAKKPSVQIKEDVDSANQLRRYGWSAGLPISILTNFDYFAIYDCTNKVKQTDKASCERIAHFTYSQYVTDFDFFWDTFSRERVIQGGLDKFIGGDKNKKGTATVDNDFLEALNKWRIELAKNVFAKNKTLNEDELNFVVQNIINRIIFLRIAEDRNVERYGQLQEAIVNGVYYKNILDIFYIADQKYNSGLFDFKKDTISEKILIENKVIKNIVTELYPPLCPYEFSVMAVEILGSAYEQFLGKQILIPKIGKVVIEEKPEVRKAGGVYYTPQYIVEYIVENTVGKLIKDMNPTDVSAIKIVDPACGSGSFLLGAYQYLLNWHKDFYNLNEGKNKGKKNSPLTPAGELTTDAKKHILTNNIFGVDLDSNAVEVTKLSLLLKCMEGETKETIEIQSQLFHDRVLPDLDNNIKSGNSLIDLDFYENELFEEFKTTELHEERGKNKSAENADLRGREKVSTHTDRKVKPFSWNRSFSEVFKQGGFDVVIGNPPYGALFSDGELIYFKHNYNTSVWRNESYSFFIEQGLELLKHGGALGFIIPDTLLNLGFTQSLRELLLQNSKLKEIVGLPSNVFAGATVDTIILITEKANLTNQFHPVKIKIKTFGKKETIKSIENPQKELFVHSESWFEQKSFNLQVNSKEKKLLSKIEGKNKTINDIAEMFSGIKSYEVGKGKPAQTKKTRYEKPFTSEIQKNEKWRPFYDGKHIGRYQLLWKNNNWINYGEWLAAPRNPENFEGEKILIRKITGKTLLATYIPETSYCNTLLFVLKLKERDYGYKCILGVLNSNLIGWYFRKKFQINDDDTFPQIMIRDILQFPIPKTETINQKEFSKRVDQLLQLNKDLQAATLPNQIEQLKFRIAFDEDKINEIVYKLYGLTDEEIKMVEGK